MTGDRTEAVFEWSIKARNEIILLNVFHYTNKPGWNAVRAQKVWRFKANQPKDRSRPVGAYSRTLNLQKRT